MTMFKNILLSVDLQDEDSTRKALNLCVEMCRAMGAKLNILTVVPDFGLPVVEQYFPKDAEAKMIAEAKRQLTEVCCADIPEDIKVRHIVAQGAIYHRIIEMADKVDADLIVVTAHRPELKDYLLGPNAARVVRHSERSVLVVRS